MNCLRKQSQCLFHTCLFSCCLCGSSLVVFFRHLFFSFLKPDFMKCCSALLCLAAIVGCLVTTNADPTQINNAEELMQLFGSATGNTLKTDIEVTADLVFSGSGLTLPLGASSDGGCVTYTGAFHGNGHSIKGLVMNAANNEGYKNAGLFCNLKDATVDDLVIDSSCSFSGVS